MGNVATANSTMTYFRELEEIKDFQKMMSFFTKELLFQITKEYKCCWRREISFILQDSSTWT